ncbi:MAG: hypothetical protein AAF530_11460 [Pseudomonadota bacterium]
MAKSIPLSVRISDKDAEFLASFDAEGAHTPSEKLRAILATARRRHEVGRDFDSCSTVVEDLLRPSLHRVRNAQREVGLRSDFVFKIFDRMPEMMAELMAAASDTAKDEKALRAFEGSLAEQLFALMEEVLDMGLTSRSRTYDPELIKQRLPPILEVLNLIKLSQQPQQPQQPQQSGKGEAL